MSEIPAFLSGAFNSIGTSGGGLLSLVTRIFSLLPVLNLLSGRFGVLTRNAALFAGALGLMVGLMSKARAEIQSMGGALTDLRAATGISSNRAGGLLNTYNAAGIRPNQTASMLGGMNIYEQQARAQMFGVRSFADLPGMAASYQRMNPMMRSAMLGSADTPEMRRALMQNPNDLRGNMAFQNRVQGGMGVDPSVIARTSQQLELVTTRFRILGETALIRLGAEVLPRLINVLDAVSERIAARSDAIGAGIEAGVNKGFEALVRVGEVITHLPPLMFSLADGVLAFASTAASAVPEVWNLFLSGVDATQAALTALWSGVSSGFAQLMGVVQSVSAGFVAMVAIAEQAWARIQGPLANVFSGIIRFLDDLSQHPIVQRVMRAAGAVPEAFGFLGNVANTLQGGGERALGMMGANGDTAALGGLLLPTLLGAGALKFGGALIGAAGRIGAAAIGAGAGAAGAGALGAGLGGFGAVGGGLALGGLVGAGAYGQWQRFGLVDREQSFGDRMATGWGRVRDLVTFNPGNYDRSVQAQWAAQRNAPKLTDAAGEAADKIRDYFGGIKMPQMGAMQMPQFNVPGINLPQMSMAGIGGAFGSASQGTWSQNLESRFGNTVREQAAQSAQAIEGLRADLDKARREYNGDEQRRILRELLAETKNQTNAIKEGNELAAGSTDRVAGYAIWRFGMESGRAIRRAGN